MKMEAVAQAIDKIAKDYEAARKAVDEAGESALAAAQNSAAALEMLKKKGNGKDGGNGKDV
jgi:hypothetical protein